MTEVVVLRAGPLTTVQDAGRPGLAHLGVPAAGAADAPALARGNALVGNAPDAAALEATLVGPTIRFTARTLVAVTGAEAAARLGGSLLERDRPVEAAAGDILELGRCTAGVRAYICVRGGIDVAATLGSRSTDLLTGLGPPPLRDGDVVCIGPEPATQPSPVPPAPAPPPTLRLIPGPRDDWFEPSALDLLTAAGWRVTPASNRVGIRLEGPPLPRRDERELLSEGVVVGALQVPPSGQPILLLVDHPTTGGYPVIAVVASGDVAVAAQLAPGDVVRFELGA